MEYDITKIEEQANYCLNCKTKPCKNACPLGNDIPTFINYIKQKEYEKAYDTLLKTTVMSPICSKICPYEKQCQGSCVRGIKGKPVQIGMLEEFCASKIDDIVQDLEKSNNKKVAIIGGGPCGITAAIWLKKYGFDVTIYEKQEFLGGILMYGIPEFRLNKDYLNTYIEKVRKLGIKVKNNCTLGKDIKIEELKNTYDAIILAFGANISSKMGIEGEDLFGVYGGNELLENREHPDYKGKTVAVIGGGNVAIDSAREAKHLGAKKVIIIYRRQQEQMPANKEEINLAVEEGIEFIFQNRVNKIIGDKLGNVQKLECIKTELVEKENEKRKIPIDIENSNHYIDTDYVIMAIGSHANKNLLNQLNLELTDKGYIKVDDKYKTSDNKIYAGGDLIGVTATVANASKTGREIAINIRKDEIS